MTVRDEWDDGPPPNPVALKARSFQSLQAQIANLEAQAKALSYEMSREFPLGTGSFEKVFGDMKITLTRGERWTWDRTALKSIMSAGMPGDPVTEEVNRAILDNVSFHKTAFAKLSPEAQKVLRLALTVKDGPFKLEIEEHKA